MSDSSRRQGSLADACGDIARGDEVRSLNGVPVSTADYSLQDVADLITLHRATDNMIRLDIVRRSDGGTHNHFTVSIDAPTAAT